MAKPKVRVHREHFTTVELGGRKSCPTCGTKNAGQLYWWFEYLRMKRHTVKHFCETCYAEQVRKPLLEHTGPCGCEVELVCHGMSRPAWLTLEENREQADLPQQRSVEQQDRSTEDDDIGQACGARPAGVPVG